MASRSPTNPVAMIKLPVWLFLSRASSPTLLLKGLR